MILTKHCYHLCKEKVHGEIAPLCNIGDRVALKACSDAEIEVSYLLWSLEVCICTRWCVCVCLCTRRLSTAQPPKVATSHKTL